MDVTLAAAASFDVASALLVKNAAQPSLSSRQRSPAGSASQLRSSVISSGLSPSTSVALIASAAVLAARRSAPGSTPDVVPR
eukprot:4901766-Prymnesium_polylepis.1